VKILQIITRSELRGAEVFAAGLSEQLAARGHQVCLAAVYGAPSPESLAAEGVERVELEGKAKGRLEPRAMLRQARLWRRFRPDVVQANGFHALKYAVVAKRLGRHDAPLIYRNISVASGWIRGRLRRQWGRWLAKSVALVASVSDASRSDFVETYGIDPSRAFTIHRGIERPEHEQREEARRSICDLIRVNRSTPLLFHIGGFTEEKNHAGLLAAFGRIRHSFPEARLVLFGDGPLRREFECAVRISGLSSQVHCLGVRSDARDLLAGADVLLLPSRIEGIPGVVLEAAARKIPSVCTDVGAVREAVQHRVSGLLVPADDMPALAQATCELLQDVGRRREFGEAAFRYVKEHHDMQRCVDRFEGVYRDAVRENGG